MPWERCSRYEFMIALARARATWISTPLWTAGNSRPRDSQIVSLRRARMLVADALISSYNKRRGEGDRQTRRPSAPRSLWRAVPCEPSSRALALGQPRPEEIRHSASPTDLGSYEEMVLSTLASVERSAPSAIPGLVGAPALATMRPVSAYIRTIMDISRNPRRPPPRRATSEPPRHDTPSKTCWSRPEGTCRDAEGARYLASARRGRSQTGERTGRHLPPDRHRELTAQQTPAQDLEPPPNAGSRHR
ncbi:hypothetical protein Q5P01_000835 [Channa striata]|uniref:Uncharacterized protein n=1 Tax=Channa striata TaxID=64152 RepID=A0AA88IHV8_CHASR|nr:hypothetical protein Q5P01_000835 [Channa striata]